MPRGRALGAIVRQAARHPKDRVNVSVDSTTGGFVFHRETTCTGDEMEKLAERTAVSIILIVDTDKESRV